MILTETVSTCVEPSQSSEALVTEMALPPAMRMRSPYRIVAMAKVMISGGQTQIADAEAIHRSDSGGGKQRESDCSQPRGVDIERHQRKNDGSAGLGRRRSPHRIDTFVERGVNGLAVV